MIVRSLKGAHYLACQPEHARQSAVITSNLRDEFFADPAERQEIIRATKRHDDGWAVWESSPQTAESGLPLNFLDISHDLHQENWSRTIEIARRRLSPFAATIIARHAGKFLQEYGTGVAERHAALVEELKAATWPDASPEERCRRTERGFAALFAGDALSLIAAAGWDATHELVLHQAGGTPFPFRAWRDGDWVVRVDPWPFRGAAPLEAALAMTVVPAGEERRACELLRTATPVLVPVKYLSAR